MKIPDSYSEYLNDIIKSVDKSVDALNAGDLFLAYKRVLFVEDRFVSYGVSVKTPIYGRLLKVKAHVELLLIKKLSEYEVLKMRVESYASKS